jgi:ubiquinone/menaquinone biosynthesis C-methylase UbiE
MITEKEMKIMGDDRHTEEIGDYWTKRSEKFNESRIQEIEDGDYLFWINKLNENMEPGNKKFKVLDCGCGPGLYSILLGREGHYITAIDYADGMVEKTRENLRELHIPAIVKKMDAHNLEFENDTFDLVVSRNMLWTVADPAKVYSEWLRVLRPGGRMIIFDGNYTNGHHNKDYQFKKSAGWKEKTKEEQIEEFGVDPDILTNITKEFKQAYVNRPQWDIDILIGLDVKTVKIDLGQKGNHVERDGKKKYLPDSFFIIATK